MSIPGTMRWRDKPWVPTTANGTSRFELLTDMWALYDYFSRRYTRITLDSGHTLIKTVCEHRVLTHAQLAKLTGRTRQRMHIYMQENGLPMADDQGARGLLVPEGISYLKEVIVRKLAMDIYVEDGEILEATEAGSDTLLAVLTGIPAATYRNARYDRKV